MVTKLDEGEICEISNAAAATEVSYYPIHAGMKKSGYWHPSADYQTTLDRGNVAALLNKPVEMIVAYEQAMDDEAEEDDRANSGDE